MADSKLLTDDYVLNLLNEDARTANFGSLLVQKRDRNAPKPNTRFLRNIIRHTDSHNAALLAKEREESRAKRRELEREQCDAKVDRERSVKRKREGARPDRWASALGGLGKRTDDRGSGKREERHNEGGDRIGRKREQSGKEEESRRHDRQDQRLHRRASSRSRDDRAHDSKRDRHRKRQGTEGEGWRSRSPVQERRQHGSNGDFAARNTQPETTQHQGAAEDSDPLEDLIGPSPPSKTRPRGRGARSNRTSNIDLRFNDSSYDPRADVGLDPADADDGDDWDTALEAVRDRAKWRTHGAERLRAAGFAESDVERWQDGGREKDERDVKWKARGEIKEWDQGKLMDGDGDASVKAAWTTSLKDT